ncbi:MAG: HipA domain-containing protein [Lachnospiraceae bacterium]|nr:HipA domain-containing protein [Lachnospiraceae bacterium]
MHGVSLESFDKFVLPSLDDWEEDIFADYSGSDRKEGLISPNGERYLVKYSEQHTRMNDLDTSYVNNVLSEYLSSHILAIVGFDTHETFLATRNQELLVACKNFTSDSEHLIEFGRYLRKYYDSDDVGRVPEYSQLEYVISKDTMLRQKKEKFLDTYWRRFIGDALIGNFDRHMGNWGYLVSRGGGIKASPIYDNGSTLFPALAAHGMEQVLSDEKEIMKRVFLFPKAALAMNQVKLSYYDLLHSGYSERITEAVITVVPVILEKMPEVMAFIDAQDFLADIRKCFYKKILEARAEYLLKPAYEKCLSGDFDQEAFERLEQKEAYSEETFERYLEAYKKNQY